MNAILATIYVFSDIFSKTRILIVLVRYFDMKEKGVVHFMIEFIFTKEYIYIHIVHIFRASLVKMNFKMPQRKGIFYQSIAYNTMNVISFRKYCDGGVIWLKPKK